MKLIVVVDKTFEISDPLIKDLVVGKQYSTAQEIKVNKTPAGYSIIMRCDDFNQLETATLGSHLVKLITTHFPDATVELQVMYPSILTSDELNEVTAIKMLQLDDYLSEIELDNLNYTQSNSIESLWNACSIDDSDDEEELEFDLSDLYKVKRKSKSVTSSRLIKSAKRSIKKHDIIISSDKKDKRKDEKTIESFLKGFIPGKSRWIVSYRNTVLKRWMDAFTITKRWPND